MLASSLRACFHFNHYLVLVVLLLVVYSNDDDGDQRPDRAESRQREWLDKWTTQSTVNQQRTKVNNDVDKANNKHKHKKNAKAKAKAAQKRKQGFITFTWQYRRIQSVSTTALWLRIQGHHSRKRKQTHQFMIHHAEWL